MTTRLKQIGLLLVTALAVAGCQSTLLLPSSSPDAEATTLTIQAIALGPSEFALSGATNLPDNTRLTAVALRYLLPEQSTTSSEPLYSVLDYEPVTVNDGEWTTQLSLWQVADDGRYQEPWQAQASELKLAAQPSDTVQFAIMLAPQHLGSALNNRVVQGEPQLAEVLRVTAAGEPFLWADQALPVELPSGQTAPPSDLLARANGGWGKRYLMVPEPPLPYTLTPADERQTTAPLTPDQLLR
ncbi:MAG: hypothetical protein WBG38_12655 [Nodosilinea sp.]